MKKLNKLIFSLFICTILILSSHKIYDIKTIKVESNKNILAQSKTGLQGNINNIAIFIEFADSRINGANHLDDKESVENAYKIFNSDELFDMDSVNGIIKVPSFKKYYERESYGKLSIVTDIFPKKDEEVVSYKDSHPIGYYLKYDSVNNQDGYKDNNEGLKREKELLEGAIEFIKEQLELSYTKEELDKDGNNEIDAITFIVEGGSNLSLQPTWGDILWSHKSSNTGITKNILGKSINAYTLIYARDYTDVAGTFSLNRGEYGTLIHEFGHVLGYRDLYRYGSKSQPVGFFDVMGNVIGSNPQSFLTYFTSEFDSDMSWHDPLPIINKTTENITLYKPEFRDSNEKRAVKIEVGGNKDEFFVVEYYDRLNTYDSHRADSSGIIIYRVNEKNKYNGNSDGSEQGKREHIYIFRPGETALGDSNGNLKEATLNMSRKTYGVELDLNNTDFNSNSIFFSDGANSGIQIEVTGETNNSITFNIKFPSLQGDGTENNPYLINDINTYLYLMSISTKNKYYKLTTDLDFNNVSYPIINFEGSLDGNNKTLKNITTNGAGVFNNIGEFSTVTKIENLKVENITVNSIKGNNLGGLASYAENIIINNVHLKSGSVTNNGTLLHDYVSTGGFIGSVYSNVIITNSSTNLDVKSSKNVGGFIGFNQNALIKNCFSSGKVEGNENTGGFIGVQSISDSSYKFPENVYYNLNNNKHLQGAGGYSPFHNLNLLNEESLSNGITSISAPNTMELFINSKSNIVINTNPFTSLTYNVTIENEDIVRYENNKLIGLQKGETKAFVKIVIGTETMDFVVDVTVREMNGNITEEDMLNYLGLTKKENYLVGFTLGDKIQNIKNNLLGINGVTLKSFTDARNNEINDGIIGTGMKFTINLNNTDYTYTVVIKGDVNGDGLIYATDYVKVKNHIMGKSFLTDAYLKAADINNDNKIYATDYVQIKNHIMGKNTITQN